MGSKKRAIVSMYFGASMLSVVYGLAALTAALLMGYSDVANAPIWIRHAMKPAMLLVALGAIVLGGYMAVKHIHDGIIEWGNA